MKQLTLLILVLIFFSCKGQKKIPNFDLTAERVVDIKINKNVKKALNKLSYSSIDLHYLCGEGLSSKRSCQGFLEAKVNFYFTLTENKKELIVIQKYKNECLGNDCFTMIRQTEKLMIPLKEIKSVDISEAYSGTFGKTSEKLALLVINAEYNANTIYNQTISAQKWSKESDEISYNDNKSKDNYILFYSDIGQALTIKEAIENLAKEYK